MAVDIAGLVITLGKECFNLTKAVVQVKKGVPALEESCKKMTRLVNKIKIVVDGIPQTENKGLLAALEELQGDLKDGRSLIDKCTLQNTKQKCKMIFRKGKYEGKFKDATDNLNSSLQMIQIALLNVMTPPTARKTIPAPGEDDVDAPLKGTEEKPADDEGTSQLTVLQRKGLYEASCKKDQQNTNQLGKRVNSGPLDINKTPKQSKLGDEGNAAPWMADTTPGWTPPERKTAEGVGKVSKIHGVNLLNRYDGKKDGSC